MTTFEQQLKYEIDRLSNASLSNTTPVTAKHTAPDLRSTPPSEPDRNRRNPIGPIEGVLYAELSHAIVGAAIEVHRHIGPGQLESMYQRALAHELALREIPHRVQVPIAMAYKGCGVGEFFADLIVDGKIIVELKSVAAFHPVHTAQVLSYLRSTNLRLGLLINFNVPVLYRGVRRLIR